MRENLKHKILSLESTAGSEWEEDASSQRLTSISKEQLFQMLQKARGRYHKYKGRYSDLVKGYQVKTFVKPFVLPIPSLLQITGGLQSVYSQKLCYRVYCF